MRAIWLATIFALGACGASAIEQDAPDPPPVAFDGAIVQQASARIAHGRRIADVLGCTGCHGAGMQGKRFYELYASNLTTVVPDYSDGQLVQLLREGVHPTGRDVWGMPSEIFQYLSDPDVYALITYLRSLPPAGPPNQPRLPWEAETEKMIAEGELMPAAQWVRKAKDTVPVDLGPGHALGRYIAMVTCAECHGPKLEGNEGDTPDLLVASGYTREQFETLLATGVPVGGRQLRLMGEVSRQRFAPMTPNERDALYAYLVARAEPAR
ncbi:MAG TPA: c-type cytochrome [Sphingomicrobium sp.]|nr:c-type cytochrome [Sphingomicrobium sp.]